MPAVSINNWRDLKPAGLDLLTGEACGLSLRILFDVTEKGRLLFCKTFGLDPKKNQLGEAWNRGSKDDPHVGSVMLTQDSLPVLALFAALETPGVEECHIAYKDGQWCGVWGFTRDEVLAELDDWREAMRRMGYSVSRRSYNGTAGDRNVHQFTGRTA